MSCPLPLPHPPPRQGPSPLPPACLRLRASQGATAQLACGESLAGGPLCLLLEQAVNASFPGRVGQVPGPGSRLSFTVSLQEAVYPHDLLAEDTAPPGPQTAAIWRWARRWLIWQHRSYLEEGGVSPLTWTPSRRQRQLAFAWAPRRHPQNFGMLPELQGANGTSQKKEAQSDIVPTRSTEQG